MSETILKVSGLTKEFLFPNKKKLTACNQLSFSLKKGQTLGIVGESGSGKSTLVNMLMLMESPTAGTIHYLDKNILTLSKKEVWRIRPSIQMVFQLPAASINPKMKVIDAVTEPLFNYRKLTITEKRTKAIELLSMVELSEDYLERYPRHLSGGQCQRVSIARALSLNPDILICDEATSALDVSVQRKIVDLLMKLQKRNNMSILFISHDLALVQSFAHKILVMQEGQIVDELDQGQQLQSSSVVYTKALLNAVYSLDKLKKAVPIE